MDFKQLEAYVKTIELSSFSRAAEYLYISQPSISSYINHLEKELNTALIIRTTKDVRPTKNGIIFYEYAKNIISLKEKAIFSIKNRSNAFQGEIEIYASSVPAQYILPDIIIDFNKIYSNVCFNIIQSDTENVISNILSQNCEVGIVGNKIDSSKCNYRFIVSETLVLIAPTNWNVSAKNFTEYIYSSNFVTREEGSATKYHGDEFLKNINIDPNKLKIIAKFSNVQSIIYSVSNGLGISIVSEVSAREYIKNKLISVIDLNMEMPKRDFYFVTKKGSIISPQTDLFIKYVCDNFNNKYIN